MTAAGAPPPDVRRGMGPLRLALVALLLVAIAAFEYDWLTTPLWQKTLSYCGSGGPERLLRDVTEWLGW